MYLSNFKTLGTLHLEQFGATNYHPHLATRQTYLSKNRGTQRLGWTPTTCTLLKSRNISAIRFHVKHRNKFITTTFPSATSKLKKPKKQGLKANTIRQQFQLIFRPNQIHSHLSVKPQFRLLFELFLLQFHDHDQRLYFSNFPSQTLFQPE